MKTGNDLRILYHVGQKVYWIIYPKLTGKPQKGFKLGSDMIQEIHSNKKCKLGKGSTYENKSHLQKWKSGFFSQGSPTAARGDLARPTKPRPGLRESKCKGTGGDVRGTRASQSTARRIKFWFRHSVDACFSLSEPQILHANNCQYFKGSL